MSPSMGDMAIQVGVIWNKFLLDWRGVTMVLCSALVWLQLMQSFKPLFLAELFTRFSGPKRVKSN